ncbi:MAG: hypothetical protein L6437_12935, partial [Kiritimatiellae bacterium]|nr:hypothetical protein [Kiritimatiellia bacterium]
MRYMYYGSYHGFVSDGPVVTDWRVVNETRNSGGRWYAPATERYRGKLAVHSTAPITDVKIYDGPYLFRRFCPNQTNVVIIFDALHDKQRCLFAEITDAAGKRAVTGGSQIRDVSNWRFMCSDRGNSICDAIQTDEFGPYLMGPTAPYQRKMTAFGVCAGYGTRHFNILPPDFDGGMRPVGLHVIPRIGTPGFHMIPTNVAKSTLETRMEIPICSKDGILQEDTILGYFPGPADAWSPKLAPVDIKGVKINYRYLDITPRAGDPGVILLESKILFEQPVKLTSLDIFSVFHTSQPGEADHYAMVTPEKTVSGLTAAQPYSGSGIMVPGSYVVVFPSLWGSSGAMALDDGYVASTYAKFPGVHVNVALANMPREIKAGEEIKYRLILMHGRPNELPNTDDWDNFANRMGLRGKAGYEVKDIKVGKVKGTRFLLELDPADGGFVGTVMYGNLPIRLPVRVAAMNQNWTFAWFDLDRKQWFPSAVDQVIGQGFFTLDTRQGNHRIFAGHPVLADNTDLRIAVVSDGSTKVQAFVNNGGDQPVDAIIRLNPALGKAEPVKLRLEPGEVKDLEFTFGG